jgi:hypothetical protein
MEKFTKEWWKNLSDEDEFSESIKKINYILGYTGKWNRNARVLEIQCGLGVMPQFMNDNGFDSYMGIDNDRNVAELWENTDILQVREPDNTGFEDNEFHLVCWFSMEDWRIDNDRVPGVLQEMERIGQGAIIVKPFEQWQRGQDTEFLAFMMENGWICADCDPVNWFYLFNKG